MAEIKVKEKSKQVLSHKKSILLQAEQVENQRK